MVYKLQKYEDCACTRVKRFYPTSHELAEALDYYERNAEYRNFERSVIWQIWRMISRFDCYALYDKMREEVPYFNDSHIETLMRNVIKKNYGHTVCELLQIYRNADYHNIEV